MVKKESKGILGKVIAIIAIIVAIAGSTGIATYKLGVSGVETKAFAEGFEKGKVEGIASVPVSPVINVTEIKSEAFAAGVASVKPEVVTEYKDNGNLAYLEQALVDRAGFNDEFDIVDVYKAEDLALSMAIVEIEDNFADLLEDEGIVKDEDKVEIVKVYSDWDDVSVLKSDFEDGEYKFDIKVKVEDTKKDVKKYIVFTVKIEDGESKISKVVEV